MFKLLSVHHRHCRIFPFFFSYMIVCFRPSLNTFFQVCQFLWVSNTTQRKQSLREWNRPALAHWCEVLNHSNFLPHERAQLPLLHHPAFPSGFSRRNSKRVWACVLQSNQQWKHTHSYEPKTVTTWQGPLPESPAAQVQMLLPSMVHHQLSSLQRDAHGHTFLQRTDPRKTRRHACGEKLASKHANPLHKGSPRSSLSVYHSRHRAG